MSEKFVSSIVLKYAQNLERLTKSFAANTDEESLHQLRVNMRRLHNSLWLFQTFVSKKKYKRGVSGLQISASAPGQVRDLDVRLGLLKQYTQSLTADSEKTQVNILLSKIEKEKAALQSKTLKVISSWRKAKTTKFLKKTFRTKPLCYLSFFDRALYAEGKKKVHRRLLEFLSFEPYVNQPKNIKKLHQLRISAKYLRYTLEELAPLYDPLINSYIQEVCYFHRSLGDLHDLDIAVEWLSKLLTWQKGNKDFYRSLINLQIFLAKKREKVYGDFVEHWNRCREERVFEELLGCVYSAHYNCNPKSRHERKNLYRR
jgi:CHAD domain-containing protein